MLSYDDMKETVGAIQRLAADEPRLRGLPEQSLQKKELVDEAVEVLRERASFRSIAIGVWLRVVCGSSSFPRKFGVLPGCPWRREVIAG